MDRSSPRRFGSCPSAWCLRSSASLIRPPARRAPPACRGTGGRVDDQAEARSGLDRTSVTPVHGPPTSHHLSAIGHHDGTSGRMIPERAEAARRERADRRADDPRHVSTRRPPPRAGRAAPGRAAVRPGCTAATAPRGPPPAAARGPAAPAPRSPRAAAATRRSPAGPAYVPVIAVRSPPSSHAQDVVVGVAVLGHDPGPTAGPRGKRSWL